MVIHLRRSEVIKIEGRKQEDARMDVGVCLAKDVRRSAVGFVGVWTTEVEVVLVGGDFLEEVMTVSEGLDIEELGFFEGMEAFDIGIGVGASWGDEDLASPEVLFDHVSKAAIFLVEDVPPNSPPLSVWIVTFSGEIPC